MKEPIQMDYIIRLFQPGDGKAVADLLARNFIEINSKDYPPAQIEKLIAEYTPEKMTEQATFAHTYVAESDHQIIGTGTICPFWGSMNESIILSLFVLPDFHGKGIGSALMKQLENDSFYTRSLRIEVPASKTAKDFYLKLGFQLKDLKNSEDKHGYILLEKFLSSPKNP